MFDLKRETVEMMLESTSRSIGERSEYRCSGISSARLKKIIGWKGFIRELVVPLTVGDRLPEFQYRLSCA